MPPAAGGAIVSAATLYEEVFPALVDGLVLAGMFGTASGEVRSFAEDEEDEEGGEEEAPSSSSKAASRNSRLFRRILLLFSCVQLRERR